MNVILLLSLYLFCAGLVIVITRRNALMILLGIELMLNAGILNFVYFGSGAEGQMYALFIIVLAAAEAAIGLAIVIQMFRRFKTISWTKFRNNPDEHGAPNIVTDPCHSSSWRAPWPD